MGGPEAGEYCDEHKVPLVSYDGLQWCRFCVANLHSVAAVLTSWLLFCQWALDLLAPLCVLTITTLVPVDTQFPISGQSRVFWVWLLPINTFVATWLAIFAGHGTLRILGTRHPDLPKVVSWFHPNHGLRDVAVLSVMIGVLYGAIVRIAGDSWLGLPATTSMDWLSRRAPAMSLATFVALLLADRLGIITRGALLPSYTWRPPYVLVYCLWMIIGYLPTQKLTVELAMAQHNPAWLILSLSAFATFFCAYIVVEIVLRAKAHTLGRVQPLPVRSTIALVGPSGAGKTVFLARAYSLLRSTVYGCMMTLGPSQESMETIEPIIRQIEETREWASITVDASVIPFSLDYGLKQLVHFSWMDLPGGVFTGPGKRPELADLFYEHLVNCDAVVMMVDARDLDAALSRPSILHEEIYLDVARRLYARLEQVGKGGRSIPLAVIVTQCCRVPSLDRNRCIRRLRRMVDYWRGLSQQCGLGAPSTRIFFTSAVVTRDDNNKIPDEKYPLFSEQCREPVLWLAAQTVRANISLLDLANGFHGRSELQETVMRLEALANRRD